jgi:hypothetical protein
MIHFRLGAIDIFTNLYTSPNLATKNSKYKCVECSEPVIFKKGNIRVPHFSHYANSNCTYYDHPNESQIHKDAKLRILLWLEKGIQINILKECYECNYKHCIALNYISTDQFKLEYRFDLNNLYRADLAVLSRENQLKYIIEVKNKHKTEEDRRPEPWFEIEAEEIIQKELNNFIELNDVRIFKCKTIDLENDFEKLATLFGYYDQDKNLWKSKTEEKLNEYYWTEFLKNQKCLKCIHGCETKFGKPFCKRCYFKIVEDEQIKLRNMKRILLLERINKEKEESERIRKIQEEQRRQEQIKFQEEQRLKREKEEKIWKAKKELGDELLNYAKILGYFYQPTPYKFKSDRLLDEAKGFYYCSDYIWSKIQMYSENNEEIWKKIIEYQCCIKCCLKVNDNTICHEQPFCGKCKKLSIGQNIIFNKKSIDTERHKYIIESLSFIDKIPGKGKRKPGIPCHLCGKLDTWEGKCYIKWRKDEKNICLKCLEKQIINRNIV